MEETIDLREYFEIIKKKWWIILLITSIAIIISACISYFMLTPEYQTSTTLIVNTDTYNKYDDEDDERVTGEKLSVSQKLAVTYGEILKSRSVIEPVIENLGLNKSYGEIASNISVSLVQDTQIIKVSVKDTNKKRARDIANEIPKVFSEEVKRISKFNSIAVVDEAVLPGGAISPNKKQNILIAAVLGLMVSLFVIFIIEYFDNKIKTIQDVEKYLGLPILGIIPNEELEK